MQLIFGFILAGFIMKHFNVDQHDISDHQCFRKFKIFIICLLKTGIKGTKIHTFFW